MCCGQTLAAFCHCLLPPASCHCLPGWPCFLCPLHFTYNTMETWERTSPQKKKVKDKNAKMPKERFEDGDPQAGRQSGWLAGIQAGVHSFKLSTRRSRPRPERQNPPANPLNFKLTHMLGCLRTIIIITVLMMRFVLLSFPVSLAFCCAVYQIVNGYQGRAGDYSFSSSSCNLRSLSFSLQNSRVILGLGCWFLILFLSSFLDKKKKLWNQRL